MALIARFATGLFNAALRALLNRPVAQLANRAIFAPIAFTIIDYSYTIVQLYDFLYIKKYKIRHKACMPLKVHGSLCIYTKSHVIIALSCVINIFPFLQRFLTGSRYGPAD